MLWRILAVSAVWGHLAWCQQHFVEGGDVVTLGAGNSESSSYRIPHMSQVSSNPWNPTQYENNHPYRNTHHRPKPVVQNAMQKRAASAFDREVEHADTEERQQVIASMPGLNEGEQQKVERMQPLQGRAHPSRLAETRGSMNQEEERSFPGQVKQMHPRELVHSRHYGESLNQMENRAASFTQGDDTRTPSESIRKSKQSLNDMELGASNEMEQDPEFDRLFGDKPKEMEAPWLGDKNQGWLTPPKLTAKLKKAGVRKTPIPPWLVKMQAQKNTPKPVVKPKPVDPRLSNPLANAWAPHQEVDVAANNFKDALFGNSMGEDVDAQHAGQGREAREFNEEITRGAGAGGQ